MFPRPPLADLVSWVLVLGVGVWTAPVDQAPGTVLFSEAERPRQWAGS